MALAMIVFPSLPNYYFEYVTTPYSAGGVGMFINSNSQYDVLEHTFNSSYQALWIDIVDASKLDFLSILMAVFYRTLLKNETAKRSTKTPYMTPPYIEY